LGKIPEHVLDEIARATDMVSLVKQYVQLKRKGSRLWGLCPFHKEKTPSFTVNAEKGLFKCFGCNEGGNAFNFLMKIESVSFPEAVRMLAERAGIDLGKYSGGSGESESKISRMRAVNEFAADYFERMLSSGRGRKAREYLAGRLISRESIEKWRIGYVPDGWHNLSEAADPRGFAPSLLAETGLAVQRDSGSGVYDRFRDRIMFPITDRAGRVIGFGGRQLEEGNGPKYMNSPESVLFSKGRNFYGLAEAKEEIMRRRRAAVVEGYMDVIMAHQSGVTWTVGVLGTALTESHANRLKRLCDTAVLVFDADEAGQRAAARSMEVLLAEDLAIKIATLPGGMDPFDFLTKRGGEEFSRLLGAGIDFFQFRIKQALEQYGDETIENRQQVFKDLLPLAMASGDPTRRDMLVRSIARELRISERAVWQYVNGAESRRMRPRSRADSGPPIDAGGKRKLIPRLLREIIALICFEPALFEEPGISEMLDCAEECEEKRLLRTLFDYVETEGPAADISVLIGRITEAELAAMAADIIATEETRAERMNITRRERLISCLDRFRDIRRRRRTESIKERLSRAADDDEEAEFLRILQRSKKES